MSYSAGIMTAQKLDLGGRMSALLGVRNRNLVRLSSLAFSGVLGSVGLVVLTGTPAAAVTCAPNGPGAQQCFFTNLNAPEPWVVPASVTQLDTVYLRGGDGGDAIRRDDTHVPGGVGGEANATNVLVTPGSTITFYIGAVGQPNGKCGGTTANGGPGGRSGNVVTNQPGIGGTGGFGGNGLNGGCGGGGGGGGTFMMAGNALPGAATPLLAAGGGGGGGNSPDTTVPAGGHGGGDSAAAGGQVGAAGGHSGDLGGAGGTGSNESGDNSMGSVGGDGGDGAFGGGGGGGGYCAGGGGGAPSTAADAAGGGGGGKGFDQGDTPGTPCDVPGFVTTSVPTRDESHVQPARATLLTPGSAVITFHVDDSRTPRDQAGGRDGQRHGHGHGQCNHDPGFDPSNDPNDRRDCRERGIH